MNTTYLNARCQTMLQMLLASDSYISMQQIASELQVSQRSVYYDLCRINDWLAENNIEELSVVRGKGLRMSEKIKDLIEDCTETGTGEDSYIYSPTERVQIIICAIIYSDTPVHIDQLIDYCKVSRNTIFNDLQIVIKQLQKYDLNLEYQSKKGYLMAGDAIKIRAVFLQNFQELENLFSSRGLSFINKKKINEEEEILKQIEKELGVEYISESRKALAVLLPMMERGDDNIYFADLKKEEMEKHREYELVGKYFPKLCEKEKTYLCLHLLGGRIATITDDIFENTSNERAYEIAKAMISEFEKVACVTFERREELERQLFIHINASLYRYQYGIQSLDSLNVDIIREYPDLFEITKVVSKYLEKQIGLSVPDTEVAYLALHFGAYLPIVNNKTERIRVLVVCANGISTGNMLKRELIKMFPEIEIVGVESTTTVLNAQARCEMIVSSVKLKSVVPVVQVHPILTGRDKEMLARNFKMMNNGSYINAKELLDVMKPFITNDKLEQAKAKLEEYLYQNKSTFNMGIKQEQKKLFDVLDEPRIEIHNDNYKWTQSLWVSGEYLMEQGSIQSPYIDSIISQLQYYGPYMFIAPRVILAHSKPEIGVNKLDCAIHIFKRPVFFSEKEFANVIVFLAAEDQESHLKILRDIMTLFEKDETVDILLEMHKPIEVLKYFEVKLTKKE